MMNYFRVVLIALAFIAVLAGCEKASQKEVTVEVPLGIKALWVTNIAESGSARVGKKTFVQSDPMVVNIELVGSGSTNIDVTLFYMNDGKKVANQKSQLELPKKNDVVFTFKPEPTWNIGRYLLEFKLNEKVMSHQEIEVVAQGKSAP
ncbi:MAG: hypothetical protein ACREPB_04095 [Arenimonas sp.]